MVVCVSTYDPFLSTVQDAEEPHIIGSVWVWPELCSWLISLWFGETEVTFSIVFLTFYTFLVIINILLCYDFTHIISMTPHSFLFSIKLF